MLICIPGSFSPLWRPAAVQSKIFDGSVQAEACEKNSQNRVWRGEFGLPKVSLTERVENILKDLLREESPVFWKEREYD